MTFDPNTIVKQSEDTLGLLKEMGEYLTKLKDEQATLACEMSIIADNIGKLETQTLPSIMRDAGIKEFVMADGAKITLYPFVSTKIKSETAAYAWLRQVGEHSIIKNKIEVYLNIGEDALAESILEYLNSRHITAESKKSIHPSTLLSFVKNALEHPELSKTIPREVFGIFECDKVKYKQCT